MHRLIAAVIVVAGTLACAPAASAQAKTNRGWFDVSVGAMSPADNAFTASYTPTIFGEPAAFTTDYTLGTATAFGIGAGAMFHKRFGAGVTFTNSRDAGDPALLSARVPHPFLVNVYGTDTDVTSTTMARAERGFHFHAMVVLMDNGKVRIRAFGGPSYLRMTQNVVEDFAIKQTINGATNTVTVGGSDVTDSVGSTWGYHAGGDVTYFFAKTLGVGGFVRYVNGSVDVTNPIAQTGTITLKLGGVQHGASLNVKF